MQDGYHIYSFILCLIVFTILTAVFVVIIVHLLKLNLKLIRHGVEDEKITTEYYKSQKKGKLVKTLSFIDIVFSVVICILVLSIFVFSLFVSIKDDKVTGEIPTIQIVKSGSMSAKHERNEYLFKNNLNDQFNTFDIILTHKLPDEFDLKLYDIVVYEVDNTLIIHRIVGIEEPNSKHPNERHFLLQGDNNDRSDRFPVRYNQMKGIYRGQRVPFVGSFVNFMQSPAGYLCVLLVAFAIVAMPLIDNKLKKEKMLRLCLIGIISEEDVSDDVAITVDQPSTKNKNKPLTFREKLDGLDHTNKERYKKIIKYLSLINGLETIESKQHLTFKRGNLPIARITIVGKTLNVLFALPPDDFKTTKYIYSDLSASKTHGAYPMLIKMISERRVHWCGDLVNLLIEKHKLNEQEVKADKPIQEIVQKEETIEQTKKLNIVGNNLTFRERLEKSDLTVKARYKDILEHTYKIKGIRTVESKKYQSFKKGNTPVIRLAIKGKTLNAYLSLKPENFKDSKYIYTDVSAVTLYKNYPMRVKVSSERQARWVKELIDILAKDNDLFMYAISQLKQINGNERTFKQKLIKSNALLKLRYRTITEHLKGKDGVKNKLFNKHEVFKFKNKPVAKIKIVGKTLNIYLSLQPKEFKNTKYKFTDVSNVKAHSKYPMRFKITSERKVKHVKELIDLITK